MTGESRADGLTVEEARESLAGNEVLLHQFNEVVARRQVPGAGRNAEQEGTQ